MSVWSWRDDKDLPVTKGGDGGDSCAIAGNYATTGGVDIPMYEYLKASEPLRHPDGSKWYGRLGRFSRDQLIALLCGFAMNPNNWVFLKRRLFIMHSRLGFCLAWNYIRNHVYESYPEHMEKSTPDVPWNPSPKFPDVCGPEVWALWIRVFRFWPLYPFLIIFDIESLLGAVHWHFRKDRVARNHMLVAHVAYNVMPTPISFLTYHVTPWRSLKEKWRAHCEACGEIYLMNWIGKT